MISASSIKERLKNKAIETGKTMQELLIAYGLERTIYRLSISEYLEKFTLKGGIFLYALYKGNYSRVTRDIDLLGARTPNNIDSLKNIFIDIFSIKCDDALVFDLNTLTINEITANKEYHGVNVSITALLEKTKIPVSIDIGFGDEIYPCKTKMEFPVILDMDAPTVYAYSMYSIIAEKFEAIVSLGDANSRYKDFYDIYMIASGYEINSIELKKALLATFKTRGTNFEGIVAFDNAFINSDLHNRRWKNFVAKKRALEIISFKEVILVIKKLLLPIVNSIINDEFFVALWDYRQKCWKE